MFVACIIIIKNFNVINSFHLFHHRLFVQLGYFHWDFTFCSKMLSNCELLINVYKNVYLYNLHLRSYIATFITKIMLILYLHAFHMIQIMFKVVWSICVREGSEMSLGNNRMGIKPYHQPIKACKHRYLHYYM